jgi:hypothetical protein
VAKAHADRLIAELGGKLGVDGLALDDAGRCSLSVEGGVVVRISYAEAVDLFELRATLQRLSPKPAHLARTLGLNFCWRANAGATFALDRASGRLALSRCRPADGLDLAGLGTALEELVGHALAWTRILEAMKEAETLARPDAAAARMPVGARA